MVDYSMDKIMEIVKEFPVGKIVTLFDEKKKKNYNAYLTNIDLDIRNMKCYLIDKGINEKELEKYEELIREQYKNSIYPCCGGN